MGSAALDAAMSVFTADPIDPFERVAPLMPENLAYVIYTSGSTGQPKGVGNSHAGITTSLDWIIGELGITASDVAVQRCDYTFDVSVWEIFSILTVGGTLVLPRSGGARDSAHVAELVSAYRATTLFAVPTMLSEFIDNPGSAHCQSLKNIVAIGEALPGLLQERVHARLPRVRFWNSYGPTEAAVGVTLWLCRRKDGAKAPPIGSPAWNTQIHILDDSLKPVRDGEPGELFIAGAFLARGYVGMPELTAERFLPSPFGPPGARMYRTGDLAERRADGEIYFLGRNDSQVKFNGIRIELGEIEAAVTGLPGVARTAVIAREIGGENRLIAYVIMRPGAKPLVPAEAKATLGTFLPRYLVPSFFVAMTEFPLTASAKLNARVLPNPDIEGGRAPYREPQGELEVFFADTFAQLVGVPRVGADDSFFDLGGTSLTAMRLASRTKVKTGLVLPMRALVEHPTPAALAKVMAALRNGEELFTNLPFDSQPVVFVLPGVGGSDISLGEFVIACDPVLDLRILDYPDWRSRCTPGVTFQTWVDAMADAVVAAAPTGDINLTGYSLGGDVAYELAQNLRRRGRRVGFLGIIDMEAPSTRGGKASAAARIRGFAKKIARLVHDHEVALAVMTNTLGKIPPRYLPTLARVLSIGPADYRERVDDRMMITTGMSLRQSWLRIAGSYAPLEAPTFLFRVKPSTLDEGRFDGWWERCADVRPVQIDGNHFTILAPENVQSFVETYLEATRDILGRNRADPGESEARAYDLDGADVQAASPRSRDEARSDHFHVPTSAMGGVNQSKGIGLIARSGLSLSR